jgi:hypothetical protein
MTRAPVIPLTEITRFGFRFGAALVERACDLPAGRTVTTVTTDAGKRLDIYVSRTGRSLRVFADGQEWKP